MARFLLALLAWLVIVFAAVTVAGACGGCTSSDVEAWRQSHPTTQLVQKGGELAGAAISTAVTGSWGPVLQQLGSLLGWLMATPAAAIAVKRGRELAQLKQPWDQQTFRRKSDRPERRAAAAPPPTSISPTPGPRLSA